MRLYTMTELLQFSRAELIALQRLAEINLLVLPADAIGRRQALENFYNIRRALHRLAMRPWRCSVSPPP